MPRPIIGLAGTRGSGKSTASLALYRLGWTVLPFAGPLKRMASILIPENRYIYGDRKEEPLEWLDGITPRHIMQTLGTEWGRQMIHPDLWVRVWKRQVASHRNEPKGIVADDVRFQNEVDAIHELGGHVILIQRPNDTIKTEADIHASEHLKLTPDATLVNSGTIRDLETQIVTLVKGYYNAPA